MRATMKKVLTLMRRANDEGFVPGHNPTPIAQALREIGAEEWQVIRAANRLGWTDAPEMYTPEEKIEREKAGANLAIARIERRA